MLLFTYPQVYSQGIAKKAFKYILVNGGNNGGLPVVGQGREIIKTINFKKMNKADLANAVHEKIGGTKVQAEEVVELMIDGIVRTLKSGGEVSVAGLGIFSTKSRAARTARNPRTGESVQVAAMRVPKFRAAKALKDAVK